MPLARRKKSDRKKTGFGDRLRELRKEAGMTQEDLAAALQNVNRSVVARWEAESRLPGWDFVLRIAKALNVTPDAFLPPDTPE